MENLFNGVIALFAFYGGAIVGLVIGALYFTKASQGDSIALRLLSSAFGPSLTLLLAAATFLWPEQYRYKPAGVQAYFWLQLLPLVLLAISIAKYPGPRRMHYLCVPLGLFAWLWTFVIGWLFVHGE
jgi:hypothetical protein